MLPFTEWTAWICVVQVSYIAQACWKYSALSALVMNEKNVWNIPSDWWALLEREKEMKWIEMSRKAWDCFAQGFFLFQPDLGCGFEEVRFVLLSLYIHQPSGFFQSLVGGSFRLIECISVAIVWRLLPFLLHFLYFKPKIHCFNACWLWGHCELIRTWRGNRCFTQLVLRMLSTARNWSYPTDWRGRNLSDCLTRVIAFPFSYRLVSVRMCSASGHSSLSLRFWAKGVDSFFPFLSVTIMVVPFRHVG